MAEVQINGFAFPFRINGRGGVAFSRYIGTDTNISEGTHIKETITQFLLTYKGERVMQPEYGIDPNIDVLFSNLNETTRSMTEFKIREAMELWFPNVQILGLDIDEVEIEGSTAHVITIQYHVPADNITDVVTVTME